MEEPDAGVTETMEEPDAEITETMEETEAGVTESMEETDAEVTKIMDDADREQDNQSTSHGPWSPQYNTPGVDEWGNPERPYSPQYINCSLCYKQGSMYVVKGKVQRIILAIGLFLSGRHHDLPVIELVHDKQFLEGPGSRDWRKVSIHVDRMIAVAKKLKSFYVESNSIGSRIIHSLCPRLFIDPAAEFGSLDTAIDFFIEIFTGDLDKIRRRGNSTLNNFLNEKDEYEFYRVLKVRNEEHAQCLLCGRVADRKNFVHLGTYIDTFALCIYASPLVSNLMTAEQAYFMNQINHLFTCEEHMSDMAKWLKLFIEKNLHDKRNMKSLHEAADILIYENSFLRGIQTLHQFIARNTTRDPRPSEICHYCKKPTPNVYYDKLFCLSAHDNCHRENAKHILAKLKCNKLEEMERLPIELLYPAFDKLVHFLPIVCQRKAEKRPMNTNEMKILLYVLMVRYYEPGFTDKVREKRQIDPNLYYGEVPDLPKPYAPPTSLPELPHEMVRFEIPSDGYCPTEERPARWANHLLTEPLKLTQEQIEERNRIRKIRRQRKEELEKRRRYNEKLKWLKEHSTSEYDHFFTDEYLAKVDKMQAEAKAKKLAEQAAGTAQPEDENMEVDDDRMPSTSESAANVKDLEEIPNQSMDTLEPEISGEVECQSTQPDRAGTIKDKLQPSSEASSSLSHSQKLGSKKPDTLKSESQSSERPSKPKLPRIIEDDTRNILKTVRSLFHAGKLLSTQSHTSFSTSEPSETLHHQYRKTMHEETSGRVNPRQSASSERRKSDLFDSDASSSNSVPGTSDSRPKKPILEQASKFESKRPNSSERTKQGMLDSIAISSNSEPGTSDSRSRKSKHEEASKLISRKSEPPGIRIEKSRSSDSSSRLSDPFKVPSAPKVQKPCTISMSSQPNKTPLDVILKISTSSKEPQIPGAKKRGSNDIEPEPLAKKSDVGLTGHNPNTRMPSRSDETKKDRSRPGESSRHSVPPCMPSSSNDSHETLAEKLMKSCKIPLISGSRKIEPSTGQIGSNLGPGSKPAEDEKSNEKKLLHESFSMRHEQQRLPSDSRARQQSVDRQQPSSSSMTHASRSSMPPPERTHLSQFSRPDAHQRQKTQQSMSHSRERASSEIPSVPWPKTVNPGSSLSQGGISSGQQHHRTVDQQKQMEQRKQLSQPPSIRAASVPRGLQTGPVPSRPEIKKTEAGSIVSSKHPVVNTPVQSIPTTHSGQAKTQHGARAHSVSRQSSNLKILTGLSQSTPSLAPSISTSRKSIPSLMDIDPAARRSIPSLMDTELAPLRPGTSPTPLGSVRPVSGPIPAVISSLLGPVPPPGPPPFTPGVAPPNYRQGSVPPAPGVGAPGLLGAAPNTIQYGEPGLMPPGVTALQYGAGLVRQASRPPHRVMQPWEIKAEPQDTGYPDAQSTRNVPGPSQPISSHPQSQNISSDPHRRSSRPSTSLERQLLLPPPPLPPVLPPVAPATAKSSSASNKAFQMKDIKRELPDDGYNTSRQGSSQPSGSSRGVSKDDQRPRQSSQKPTSSQSAAHPRAPSHQRPGTVKTPTSSRSNPSFQRSSFGKQLSEEEIAANRLRHQGIASSASSSSSKVQQQPSTSSALLSSSLKRPSGTANQRPGEKIKARKDDSHTSRLPAPPKPPPIPPPLPAPKMKAAAEIKQEIFEEMNQSK
ncbi:hypothetical protein CAEBREN_18175 [Caenorhabditis brenneri]|uniref:Uncharacterized protein n=1 Tax=Caenorhabditis brenneri TaxID=135651 RepID=G0MAR5_CAEBE|nr:hypothetical protein CAEBREN_18175 [Caenorhabditis brenneri]